jgi:cation transport regulator ChaB
MLMDIIGLIVVENKSSHKKLFSDNTYLKIISSPLKINVETLIDSLRSAFVYGTISIRTYQEMLQIDPEQELERMKKEMADGLRDIYYPHLIQNTEKDPDNNVTVPPKVTKKQEEKKVEKETNPENMQEAVAQENLEIAPYTETNYPDYLKKYPEHARKIWISTWNSVYAKTKDETKAFKIAWNALQKYMTKLNKEKVK